MAPEVQEHPDDVLENLLAQTGNERSRGSLSTIHSVCREQKERNSYDFTLPTIGRLSEQKKGPKYTTIRTQDVQAHRYQTLINAWANYSGGITKKVAKTTESTQTSLVSRCVKYGIDPALLSIIGRLEADYKKAIKALNLLKNKEEIIVDRRKNAPQINLAQQEVLPLLTLSDLEREAVRDALSDELLARENWSADKVGRIKNANGRTIFKAGFATAVRKMNESLKPLKVG